MVDVARISVRADITELDAASNGVRRFGRDLSETNRYAQNGAAGLSQFERQLQQMNATAQHSQRLISGLYGTLAGALSVQKLVDYMDTWTNINSRLSLVTKSTQELGNANARLFDIAQNTRSMLSGTVDLFFKVAGATDKLGYSQQKLLSLVDTVKKTFTISGAGVQQDQAATLQLGQALGSGKLAGDEFKSIAENAPRLIKAIAEGSGVAVGSLKEMASQGKLTTEVVVNALLSQSQKVDAEFKRMTPTISGSWTMLENAALRYVGVSDKAAGTSSTIARSIQALANNIDGLVFALEAAAVVYVSRLVPGMLGFVAAQYASINAAIIQRGVMATELQMSLAIATSTAARTGAELANTTATLASAQANVMATTSMGGRMAAMDALNVATVSNNAAIAANATATQALAAAQAASSAATVTFAGSLGLLLSPLNLINAGLAAFVGWEFGAWLNKFEAVRGTAVETLAAIDRALNKANYAYEVSKAYLTGNSDQIPAIEQSYNAKNAAINENLVGVYKNYVMVNQDAATAESATDKAIKSTTQSILDQNKALDAKFNLEERLNNILTGKYKSQIISGAQKYGVDQNLMLAIAEQETRSGDVMKNSWKGASGLMQIMPATAKDLAQQMGTTTDKVLHDLQTNADASALYIKNKMQELTKEGKLTVENLAASYNAGFGNLKKYHFNPVEFPGSKDNKNSMVAQTIPYMNQVKAMYEGLVKLSAAEDTFAAKKQGLSESTFKAISAEDKYIQSMLEAEEVRNGTAEGEIRYMAIQEEAQNNLDRSIGLTKQYAEAQKAQAKAQAELAGLQASVTSVDKIAIMAEQLQLAGATTEEIKRQVGIYQEFNRVVGANPSIDKNAALEAIEQRVTAEERLNKIFDPGKKENIESYGRAWEQAVRNVQDSLGGAINDAMNGNFDYSKLKNSLYTALSQAISASIIDSFNKEDWGGMFSGLLAAGVTMLSSWLTKSPEKTTPSLAQTSTNKNIYGLAQMSIADSASRDIYTASTLASVQQFNNTLDTTVSLIRMFSDQIGNYASQFVSTLSSKIFGTTLTGAWTSLTNYVSTAYQSLTSMGSQLMGGVKGMVTTAANYITSLGTTTTTTAAATASAGTVNSAVSTGAASATQSLGMLTAYAGAALSILTLGYNLYEIASNDYTSTLDKVSQALNAAAMTAAAVSVAVGVAAAGIGASIGTIASAIPVVGWIVAAALQVASVVVAGISSTQDLSRSFADGWGGMLGTLMWDSLYKKEPEVNMLAYSERDTNAQTRSDAQGDYYVSSSKRSGTVGLETAFGFVEMRLGQLGVKSSKMVEEAVDGYLPLLRTVKAFDQALANSITAVDKVFGEDTLGQFKINAQFNQDLKSVDVSKFVALRLGEIGKELGATGTKAGESASVWLDAFLQKMLDPKKSGSDSMLDVFNIEAFVALQLPKLVQLPNKLAELFVSSVKSVADGATQEQFTGQMNDFFAGWEIAKTGLNRLGVEINDTALPDYLTSLVGLGMTVKNSAESLVVFASTFDQKAGDVTTAFNAAFDKIFTNAKANAFNKEQTAAYVGSYIQLATTAQELKLSVTPDELNNLANSLNTAAITATDTANGVIDQAIATANLGNVSRDAAIQQLALAGTLTSEQIAAASFSKALVEQQKTMLGGIEFANQNAIMLGTTIGNMGLGFTDVANIGVNLTNTFKDMAEAMNFIDSIAKNVFNPTEYASGKRNQAFATFNSSANALGLKDFNTADFAEMFKNTGAGGYVAQLEKAIATNDTGRAAALRNLGAAYNTLTAAETNYTQAVQTSTTANTDAAQAATEAANKQKALADAQADVNNQIARFSMSEFGKTLDDINSKIENMAKVAAENGGTLTGLNDLKNGDIRAATNDLFTEFSNIGKIDYQQKLAPINKWAEDMPKYAEQIAAAWGLSTDQVLAGINKIADARKAALDKEREDIIRNADQAAGRLNDTSFANSLWTIRDQFINTIQSAANAGAKYDQLLAIAAQGATAAGKAYADAQRQINDAFANKNNALSDKIYTLSGGKDLNEVQHQRALADLQSKDLTKQADAVQKLIDLNEQKYQAEIGNIEKMGDYLKGLLTNSELSILSPIQQLDTAKADYEKILAGANAKDQKSIDKFPEAANAYLKLKLETSTTKEEYARAFSIVRGDAARLAGMGSTEDQVKAAQIQQVGELKTLQAQLATVTQKQTAELVDAFDRVGADFVSTLQAMAGPTKNVKDDINMKIVGDAAPDAFNNFKKTIIDVLQSGVLTAEDGQLLKNSSLHLIANLSGLILTQQINGADAAAIMDASVGVVGNLGKLVNAQMISPADAVGVYNAQLGIFDGLTGLIKQQLISPDAARFVYDAQAGLIGALSEMILNNKMTTKQAGVLLVGQNDFVNNLIAVVSAGQISQESGGRIYMAQYYLIGALISAIDSGRIAGQDVSMITGAITVFSNTVSGQLKSIKMTAADNSLYSNAVTEMSTVITGAIRSQKFSAEQIGILTAGLTEYANNPSGVLAGLNFSQANLDTLKGSLSAAAGNPAKVFELLGFTPADQDRLKAGLGTLSGNAGGALAAVTPGATELQKINQGVHALATNMHDGLADVQFLAAPGNVVRAGVNLLAYNIGGGLGGVGIDNTPVNSAVNNLMASLAMQIYDARTAASSILVDASAQARAEVAAIQLQTAIAAAPTTVQAVDPVAAFNAAYQAGNFSSAASIGIGAGYSKDQIATYVQSQYGVNPADTVEYLRLQGYAAGGDPRQNMYIVDENGGEMIINSRVFNASQTQDILHNRGANDAAAEAVMVLAEKMEILAAELKEAQKENERLQKLSERHLEEIKKITVKTDRVGPDYLVNN